MKCNWLKGKLLRISVSYHVSDQDAFVGNEVTWLWTLAVNDDFLVTEYSAR
jgi:hypothetical protein